MKKRDKERVYCEELRQSGKSYTEIQKACEKRFGYKPSKGMCNTWLADFELTDEQIKSMLQRTTAKSSAGGIKGGATQRRKKQERIAKTKSIIDYEFDMDELKTAGLMLYWGEGTKWTDGAVILSNTDPVAHRFFITWLEKCYNAERDTLSFYLQIHEGLDVEGAIDFWCKELDVSKEQFNKPYIVKCNANHRKNKLYMGVLQSRINNTQLWYQIMFEIDEIKNCFPGK